MHNTDWQEGFTAVENAFPKRDITLKNAGDGGLLAQLMIGMLATLIGLGFIYYSFDILSGILSDRKLIDNHVVLEYANVDGVCESKSRKIGKFLKSCDVHIVTEDQIEVEKSFTFFSTKSGDYEVEVIAQQDDPNNVTLDLALEVMTGRYIVLAFFVLLAIAALIWGWVTFTNIPKKMRLKKIMNDQENKPWEIIAVPVAYSGDSLEYETDIDGDTKSVSVDIKGAKPLAIAETEDDKLMVLAIKARQAKTFVPLTNKYRGLGLKKDEKATINNVIANYF